MKIAYIRVSSADQNEARQVEVLKQYGIEKTFVDKASGKDMNRPEFQHMMEFAREGDVIYVSEFSRLARNARDLLSTVDMLNKKGVQIISEKEHFFDTKGPYGSLMFTIVAAFAEFERAIIKERQLEGIRIAKLKGIYKGRPKISINKDEFKNIYDRYMRRELSKVQAAKLLKISRDTFNSRIQEFKKNGDI